MNRKKLNVNIHRLILSGLLTVAMLPARAQEDPVLVSRNISVGGTDIHYKTGGNGPPLLLLHGFTLTGAQWLPFTEKLAEEYTLIIPDLPGHGRSEALEDRFTYETTARLMLGLLRQLNIGTVRGIGHSAGSITLMHMAARDPGSLESMILISGGHRLGVEGRALLMDDSFEKADHAFQDWYLSVHPGGMLQVSAIFEAMNDVARRYQTKANMERLSFSALGRMDIPALLVWGDRDPYFPVDVATELFQSLPNAQLWVIPDQHHVPLWADWGGDMNAAERFVPVAKRFFGPNNEYQNTHSTQH